MSNERKGFEFGFNVDKRETKTKCPDFKWRDDADDSFSDWTKDVMVLVTDGKESDESVVDVIYYVTCS